MLAWLTKTKLNAKLETYSEQILSMVTKSHKTKKEEREGDSKSN